MGRLKGDLFHHIYRDLAHFAATKNSDPTLTAEDHFRNGRRATIAHFTVRPLWSFFHRYVLRLGMLDGLAGFVISVMEAHCVFMKYVKLWALQKGMRSFNE